MIFSGFLYQAQAIVKPAKIDSTMFRTMLAAIKSAPVNTIITDSIKCKKVPSLDSLKVTGAGTLKTFRDSTKVLFGDYVFVRVSSLKELRAYQATLRRTGKEDSISEMILYIKGNPMYDIPVLSFDHVNNQCIFRLDRNSKFLPQFYALYTYIASAVEADFSVGFKNGSYITNDASGTVSMKYITWSLFWIAIGVILAVVAGIVILARNTTLIRVGNSEKTQFSLAMSQLAFWTVVITMSYFYIWICTQELAPITGSTLILLAVSITTTAGAKVVDQGRRVLVKDLKPSNGFFTDILSDYSFFGDK